MADLQQTMGAVIRRERRQRGLTLDSLQDKRRRPNQYQIAPING